jgi:hypothetical protein
LARAWLVCLLAMVSGCASTDTVKQARGEGTKRLFPHDVRAVKAAAVAAVRARKFEIVEDNADSLVLAAGLDWRSFGERVAVFFQPVSPRLTEVEVVSRPVLGHMNFPRDWERVLLDELDRNLRGEMKAR